MISQRDLARAVGVREDHIYRIRRCYRQPSIGLFYNIVKSLGMSNEDVVDLLIGIMAEDPELIDETLGNYIPKLGSGPQGRKSNPETWVRWKHEQKRVRRWD